jgi:hypothetical protein
MGCQDGSTYVVRFFLNFGSRHCRSPVSLPRVFDWSLVLRVLRKVVVHGHGGRLPGGIVRQRELQKDPSMSKIYVRRRCEIDHTNK